VRETSATIVAISGLLVGLTAGCTSFNKSITESVLARTKPHEWNIHYASRLQYTLTNRSLLNVEFEGSRNAGNTVVRYQRGLGEAAQCLADRSAGLLEAVQRRTGVVLSTRSTIYLIRLEHQPQDFTISLTSEPNEFALPLFVQAGHESCEDIVTESRSYPYLLVHEVVETSLVSKTGGAVLPDLAWGVPCARLNLNNYTRWFRDGLANYAGFITYETTAAEFAGDQKLYQQEALVHTEPFSSLAQVGDRLFSWPQASKMEQERAYYNAALGLFLLIADTSGEQAIRDIVHEIARRRAVNGRDLIEITNRVLQTDVRRLAADFEFPQIGAEAEQMTLALALNEGVRPHAGLFVQAVHSGGLAKRAGLREKDVIIAVGGTSVANRLDFELGLFKMRKSRTVPLVVQRVDAGTLTLELQLQ
jgi:hypothetical protein